MRTHAPIGVAKTAKKHRIPVIAIAGNVGVDSHVVHEHEIDAVFSTVPGILPLSDAFENASVYVERLAETVIKLRK